MTKQQFLDQVAAKKGFHSIIKDDVAPDNVPNDPIEKRYLYVNHTNADGTMGKTFVYYLYDTSNDNASFYNVEPESVDQKEPSVDQKKLNALETYLSTNFNAFFVLRFDMNHNWAEADVFKVSAGKLTKGSVLVFKQKGQPINHLEIISV